ncbi:hypothetical protein QC5_0512 [Clostridioides difficile CD34]|nr:hypothetical protein QC5_0512 [Clostridioides difficile CD34]
MILDISNTTEIITNWKLCIKLPDPGLNMYSKITKKDAILATIGITI